ncbi:MAG: hypothetical protein HYS86_00240 [Candidatus Chisholmbacteria bacterium]|nr:hypothetical protein [Candidatus Chisholmbacteria bacterium]
MINSLVKIIALIFLTALIAATLWFSLTQYQKSQTVDEALVSNLTTRLDTRTLDQAIEKITPQEP